MVNSLTDLWEMVNSLTELWEMVNSLTELWEMVNSLERTNRQWSLSPYIQDALWIREVNAVQ